jgi:hypothetical protein
VMQNEGAGIVWGLGDENEAAGIVWGLGDTKRSCWDHLWAG